LKKVKKMRNNSGNISKSRDDLKRPIVKRDLKNTNISIAMPAFLLGDELIISGSDISRYAKPAKLQVIIKEKQNLIDKSNLLSKQSYKQNKKIETGYSSNNEARKTRSRLTTSQRKNNDQSINLPEMSLY